MQIWKNTKLSLLMGNMMMMMMKTLSATLSLNYQVLQCNWEILQNQ
jgi:hypothetical protein